MTREEATKNIKEHCYFANLIPPAKEALDMAIEALEQEPKMGKWKYIKEEDSYRCSLCTYPCHKDNLGAIPTMYCAGCGAVMEV